MRLVTVFALACAAVPAAAQVVTAPPLAPGEVLLEVTADGRAFAAPDRVALTGGVVSTGATAREALDANARSMERVVEALRRAGVRGTDIQTRQINVQPRFERSREYAEQPRITGYVAQNSVAVATRRLDLAPRLIEVMFAAGANNVAGPYFTLENDRDALGAARRDAVARARSEADTYAAAFGMRVARVVHVAERQSNLQTFDSLVTGEQVVVTGSRGYGEAAPPPPPAAEAPVEAGRLSQNVTLQVDFALVPR